MPELGLFSLIRSRQERAESVMVEAVLIIVILDGASWEGLADDLGAVQACGNRSDKDVHGDASRCTVEARI